MFTVVKTAVHKIKFAEGGMISGNSHSSGGVDINVEGGEYIHPKSAVKYYGTNAMEAIRTKTVPRELLQSFSSGRTLSVSTRAETGGFVNNTKSISNTSITNIIDPYLIDRHLQTSKGRNSMLNFISDNSNAITSNLGLT